jgi:3-deoxy-D-manno-octulosonate 8-phosphate phosphatase (KDO 8-P phosphatase)
MIQPGSGPLASAASSASADVRARAARISLLLVDVDGTLTDGGLYYLDTGGFALRFHVRDGLGLARARRAGLLVGLVSGRDVAQVRQRAAELSLDEVYLGVRDKQAVVEEIAARRGIPFESICFVGDDLVDLPAMSRCGLGIAVADAMTEVLAAAAWITPHAGGHGAVRDAVDLILSCRDAASPP